jgi:hypothetical protein
MRAMKPIRDASDDLANIVAMILKQQPWDVTLVQKALHCYRSWFNYAAHIEEVKFEILFPYLPSQID